MQYAQQNLEILCKTNKHEKSGKKSKKVLAKTLVKVYYTYCQMTKATDKALKIFLKMG